MQCFELNTVEVIEMMEFTHCLSSLGNEEISILFSMADRVTEIEMRLPNK